MDGFSHAAAKTPWHLKGALGEKRRLEGLGPSRGALSTPYLGPGWGREALKRMATDDRVQEALRGVEASILVHFQGAPEGRYHYLYAQLANGQVLHPRLGYTHDGGLDGLPKAEFVLEGPYEVFAAIQEGRLSERKAFVSGDLKFTGPKLKALRLFGALERLTKVLREIPCHT